MKKKGRMEAGLFLISPPYLSTWMCALQGSNYLFPSFCTCWAATIRLSVWIRRGSSGRWEICALSRDARPLQTDWLTGPGVSPQRGGWLKLLMRASFLRSVGKEASGLTREASSFWTLNRWEMKRLSLAWPPAALQPWEASLSVSGFRCSERWQAAIMEL